MGGLFFRGEFICACTCDFPILMPSEICGAARSGSISPLISFEQDAFRPQGCIEVGVNSKPPQVIARASAGFCPSHFSSDIPFGLRWDGLYARANQIKPVFCLRSLALRDVPHRRPRVCIELINPNHLLTFPRQTCCNSAILSRYRPTGLPAP